MKRKKAPDEQCKSKCRCDLHWASHFVVGATHPPRAPPLGLNFNVDATMSAGLGAHSLNIELKGAGGAAVSTLELVGFGCGPEIAVRHWVNRA